MVEMMSADRSVPGRGPIRRLVGGYENRVLPRLLNALCGSSRLDPLRARAAAGLSGTVLEIGFGSGLNLAHLPATVVQVLAVEPASGARDLAAARLADSPVPVAFVGRDGAALDVADHTVDAALSTFTLCSIAEVEAALAELVRVLRPGGRFHFVEHGRAESTRVQRRQRRLTPWQRRAFGGCHLDRPIDELIVAAGFTIVSLDRGYHGWPRMATYLYQGVARAPA